MAVPTGNDPVLPVSKTGLLPLQTRDTVLSGEYENKPETRMIRHGLDVGVPAIRGFMRQPLMTSCVGLAQGCNPLASAVFFGAYLCSDRLSCESLLN